MEAFFRLARCCKAMRVACVSCETTKMRTLVKLSYRTPRYLLKVVRMKTTKR